MCLSSCDSSWLTVIVPSRSFGKNKLQDVLCFLYSSFWEIKKKSEQSSRLFDSLKEQKNILGRVIADWSQLLLFSDPCMITLSEKLFSYGIKAREHQRSRRLNSNGFCSGETYKLDINQRYQNRMISERMKLIRLLCLLRHSVPLIWKWNKRLGRCLRATEAIRYRYG